jgi:transketolase
VLTIQSHITPLNFAKAIRLHALQMVHAASASHIGSCFSMADILAVLYTGNIFRYDSAQPEWPERDILLVSKGHAAAIMYAALAEAGYYDASLLASFCQNGSLLQGHISHHVPGVELSTGSLGHALSVACGMAIAARAQQSDRRIFVILSDGELDEGSNWEAILFAGHHTLHNLTVIIDYNKIQSFGHTQQVLGLEPLADKWRSFKWNVDEVDGHDYHALLKQLQRSSTNMPSVLIAHTIKGKGVSFMEGALEWHYKSPSLEQLQQAVREIEAAS